jgi:hypothetical protein
VAEAEESSRCPRTTGLDQRHMRKPCESGNLHRSRVRSLRCDFGCTSSTRCRQTWCLTFAKPARSRSLPEEP